MSVPMPNNSLDTKLYEAMGVESGENYIDKKAKHIVADLIPVFESELQEAVQSALYDLRPPLTNERWYMGSFDYLGKTYGACTICGFSPGAMNAHIDNRLDSLSNQEPNP